MTSLISDIVMGFIVLCFGFGLGAAFSRWQLDTEAQIDADDEKEQQLLDAQYATAVGLPPEWLRPGLN